jgi:beta-glucanase (GH16 family)
MITRQVHVLWILLATSTIAQTLSAQTLVWSDEFNDSTVDHSKWTYNTGGSGFGNGELQYYTARPENVAIDSGDLVIEARHDYYLGDKEFTSARLLTNGRFSFKYGTLEARINLPDVDNGLWPAFWTLGTSHGALGWPACGELDIMEVGPKHAFDAGVVNHRVVSAAHWDFEGGHALHDGFIDLAPPLHDDYHVFKMVWTPTVIQTFVDDTMFWSLDISNPASAGLEEHHDPKYIIINLAVGGWNFVEITDPAAITAPFPAQMHVDYIRLYDNGDTELFYGTDVEESGDFGVFTDTTPVDNSVQYGTDAELLIWNNLTEQVDTPYEGSEVWSMTAAAGDWWGMGVLSTQADRNLARYSDGHLHLHMKTTSTEPFKIGMLGTASGESWVQMVDDAYGLVRDGNWHEVIIPLNAFLNVDFPTASQLFMIAGDPPAAPFTFSIDNIYFTPDVPRATPQNGTFGIYTEDPTHKTAGEYALGIDGGFFIWEDTLVDAPQTPLEGAESISLESAPGFAWFGAAFTPTIKYNLSGFRFPESMLHVALKTSSSTPFRLGMRSGNVDDIGQKWIHFDAGSDPYGFARDGQWHALEIPMSDFTDSVDLTAVSMLFQVLGVNGAISDLEFDDVYMSGGGDALVVGAGYPIANAGQDQLIVLPTDTVVIDGTGSQDDGVIMTFAWQQLSGPSIATLSGENTAILTASDLIEGAYVFRLTTTDDEALEDHDDVTVTVATASPMAFAGNDQSVALPDNSVTLSGSGSDADGVIVSYEWLQISGPSTATLTDAKTADATASDLAEGSYVFELTVTDDDTLTASDEVTVDVTNEVVNIALGKPTTASSTASGSLASNGGFESGSGTSADDWSLLEFAAGGSIATAQRVSTLPYSGSWRVDLNVAGAPGGGPAAEARQTTPTGSVTPGTTYDHQLQMRRIGSLGAGVVVQIALDWLDTDGSHGGGVKGTTGFFPVDSSLTESYAQFGFGGVVAAPDADAVQIIVRMAGGAFTGSDGQIAIDEVILASTTPQGSELAVDGDGATRWASSSGDPQWIEVDLGDSYEVSQIVLEWAGAYALEYDLDMSDDGVLWTTLHSTTTGVGGTEVINVAGIGDYLRLYAHAGASADGTSLFEFEAYGTLYTGTGGECVIGNAASCADVNGDDIRDDNCVWWECTGSCLDTPLQEFADMGGGFGDCPPDGFANIHDRNHALTCFANTNPCDRINVDAGGAFGDCAPDGFCNIHDANHALNAFAGTTSCSCPSGPAPEFGPQVVGEATLRLEPRARKRNHGGTIDIDVFVDGPVDALRSYQLDVQVSGGKSGKLHLVAIRIDDRPDVVFGQHTDAFNAFNVRAGQMLSGVADPSGAAKRNGAYLATYSYMPTPEAEGDFVVDVIRGPGNHTFLVGSFDGMIVIESTRPAVVSAGVGRRTFDRN